MGEVQRRDRRGASEAAGCALAVDVGNTFTRFGLVMGDEVLSTWAITTRSVLTSDEALMSLESFFAARAAERPTDAIVSSVVPVLTDVWVRASHEVCERRPLVVGPGLKTGLRMRYNDPAEIGSDRIADMAAAKKLIGAPCVVVDLGTTTNFEVIDETGAFVGGIIAPGLRLSAAALADAAAKLPTVEMKAPANVIGKNTREAMQSGAVLGEAVRIDGLLSLIEEELGYRAPAVISGADAAVFAALSRHELRVEEDLTLRGLGILRDFNRK